MSEKLSSSDLVYSILEQTQLEKFWPKIRDDLQISRISHFNYVKSKDLENIGISKPAARRLLDYVRKINNKEITKKSINNELNNKDLNRVKKAVSLQLINEDLNINSASFIINENDLQISNTVLGSGHFGIVKKAVWTTPLRTKLNVAVKLLHENILSESKQTLNDFLSEISYMCSLHNKNLTKLYGIVLTTQTKSIIMVTELAPIGSLLNYIKKNSSNILLTTLHAYSYQISAGMEYLESKKLIHRDLAARNILLFTCDKVKICDFGMMRRLNDKNDYFHIETNSKIPYAWAPPECLKKKLFSIKSDVWMFGITLWEIYTFGERPWLNFNSTQILEKIENNERLKKPDYCSSRMYSILLKCWLYDCSARPSFQYLTKYIREIYPNEMKAKQNFNEPNRLEIRQSDTITIIDGQASKYWWFGQNNRTFQFGYFPRMLLDPQRRLNSEDISLPLKHSFIHTGHMSANANQIWGYPDKIDDIFLKNPLNPPDLLINVDNTNKINNENVCVKLGYDENIGCLIDLNDEENTNNDLIVNNNNNKIYYANNDMKDVSIDEDLKNLQLNYLNENYIKNTNMTTGNSNSATRKLNNASNGTKSISGSNNQTSQQDMYENNESAVKIRLAPSRPPPPAPSLPVTPIPTIKSQNNNTNQNKPLTQSLSASASPLLNSTANNNKKFEFKTSFDKNKVDFDEFLNKVMNDVINDLSNNVNSFKNNERQNQKNPFFYSQQTLVQPSRLPPPPPPPAQAISTNSKIFNQNNLIYENFYDKNNHGNDLYENSNEFVQRAYF